MLLFENVTDIDTHRFEGGSDLDILLQKWGAMGYEAHGAPTGARET